MAESQERMLTRDELSDIILKAEALQGLEDDVKRQRITDLVGDRNGDTVSLTTAYEISEEVGISREYFERVLEWSPDREQQLMDLEGHNTYPTIEVVVEDYKRTLKGSLEDFYPLSEFKTHPNINIGPWLETTLDRVDKRLKTRWFFGKFRKPKVISVEQMLAYLRFYYANKGHFRLQVEVDDPTFLLACSQTLRDLNKKYGEYLDHHSLERNYGIDGD